MAAEVAEKPAGEIGADSQQAAGGSPRSGGGAVKIAIAVTLAMLAEAGVFYFLGLTPNKTPSTANSENGTETSAAVDESASDAEEEDLVEVEIDSFNVTNGKAVPDSSVHVTFELVALVSARNRDEFDEAANKDHKARVRQAVVKVARSSGKEDLDDPNLMNMKRGMREQINKVLRTSYVVDVVIADFKTMEQ